MPPVPQAQIPTLAALHAAKKLSHAAQPLYAASKTLNEKVGLIRTDITTLELPNGAIVNAANKRLLGGGGVDGAIHRAAGPELLQECRGLGGAETGESKITDAYRLPCKKVIHTVGPVYGYDTDPPALLTSCYENSLKLAVDAGLDSIAFSAVSTGIYGYPSREAAHIALKTVREFLETEAGKKLGLVVFCNFEKKDEDAYRDLASLYFPPAEESIVDETAGTEKAEAGAEAPKGPTEKEVEDKASATKDEADQIASAAEGQSKTEEGKDTAEAKD